MEFVLTYRQLLITNIPGNRSLINILVTFMPERNKNNLRPANRIDKNKITENKPGTLVIILRQTD